MIPVCAEMIAKNINETLVYEFVQLAFLYPPWQILLGNYLGPFRNYLLFISQQLFQPRPLLLLLSPDNFRMREKIAPSASPLSTFLR